MSISLIAHAPVGREFEGPHYYAERERKRERNKQKSVREKQIEKSVRETDRKERKRNR